MTTEQMRKVEETAQQRRVPLDMLMESAGISVALHAWKVLVTAKTCKVLVLVGPGKNGGDGLVTARELQRMGATVQAGRVGTKSGSD
ncbi:MAG: hypothetical protein EXR67_07565 [Dehalococcoidia bacterium]|nr:hypothetical protein [Dehalococcoidia bacterium]